MDGAARRYSLKTQKLNPHCRDRKKNRARPPSVPGSGQRRTIIVTEPPDMLADVHAKFGGRPPRSRRAARPPSWRRRRDRTPRIRAAHQSRSTTSEGLRGCPRDAGSSSDSIFPTRGRPAAHRVPSTVSRGTRRETSDSFRDGRWVCGSALPFMDGTSFLRLPSRGDRCPRRRPLKCRPPHACCVFLLIRS